MVNRFISSKLRSRKALFPEPSAFFWNCLRNEHRKCTHTHKAKPRHIWVSFVGVCLFVNMKGARNEKRLFS